MYVRLNNQTKGSLTTQLPSGAKVSITPAGIELSDEDAAWLIGRYANVVEYVVDTLTDERPVSLPEPEAQPEPEPAPTPTSVQPETTTEDSGSGAISVAELTEGGRKGATKSSKSSGRRTKRT